MAVKRGQTTLVPSTVVSVKATDTFGHSWERSQKSSVVRLEKSDQIEIERGGFSRRLLVVPLSYI